jgi:DNA-binding NarL/FixJ family response regulator
MSVTLGVGPGAGLLEEYVRVLVVDDHQAVASAMALAIGLQAGLECVGSASCASEARASVAALRPDVIVMDVNLGDADGIDLAAELIRDDPRLRVVVLTAEVDQNVLRRAADAGTSALLLKDGTLPELLEALRGLDGDGFVVHPRVLRDLLRCPPAPTHTPLTCREAEVLSLLAEGHNIATISGRLGITRLTCRGYVKNLMVKLHAHSQLEAVVTARRFGLVGS